MPRDLPVAHETLAWLVRNFPENGVKWLMENPRSAAEFLQILDNPIVSYLDLEHIQQDRTTFIQPDFSHIESDIVLQAPFSRDGVSIIVYVLIEHQSEPDPFMTQRLLDYINAIYKRQRQQWIEKKKNLVGFLFEPVLPIVLYTGRRRWDVLAPFQDLVQG